MGRHSRGDDPALGRPETGESAPTGYQRAAARPGEIVGAFPVETGGPADTRASTRGGPVAGHTSGYRRAAQDSGYRAAPGKTSGSRRVPVGEASGFRPAPPSAADPTGSRRVPVGETSGFRRAQLAAGDRQGASETSGSRRAVTTQDRPAAGETTGNRRAVTTQDRPAAGETTGGQRVLTAESTGYRAQGGRRRAGASETTGSHRVAPPGEATGSHRVAGETKRGIAKWPIVSGVFVVLLVLGLLGWGWADSILSSRAEAQASACAEGDSNLGVVAAPSVAPAVTAAAERWNQARTVVHAHCVHIQVQAIDDERVLLALTGRGNVDAIGGQPAVWIPATTAKITELSSARPALLTSPAESLATTAAADYPCAVLTADDVDEVQQRAAQVFRNFLQEPAQKADFTRVLTPGA